VQRVWVGGTCAGLVLSLSGCPNPGMYTTPRTLDPRKVQWQAATEVIGVNYNGRQVIALGDGSQVGPGPSKIVQGNVSEIAPMVPSFGVRVGVAEGFEVGLRIPNLDSLAVDFKIRLLEGRFDVALDPGIQGFYTGYPDPGSPPFGVFYLQAPVLLAINVSEDLSLVLSPGFAYELTTATETCGCGPDNVGTFTAVWGAATASGPMARLGAGFDFRITKTFAIHPELTFMQEFGDEKLQLWVAGIGFNMGAQPDYSDLAQATSPPAL
jgi:hypothetical protein